jgi:hypothetical protein
MKGFTVIVAAGVAGLPSPALAQAAPDDRAQRIEAIEKRIEQLLAEVQQLKQSPPVPTAVTPPPTALADPAPPPNPLQAGGSECRLDSDDAIGRALADSTAFARCYTLTDASRPDYVGTFGTRNRLLPGDDMTAQPGRPLQASGIVPQLEFGNSGRASITATVPLRIAPLCRSGCDAGGARYTRHALSAVGSFKTDLKDGVGTFLDRREREGRSDLDYLPGTSVKLGFDYLRYSRGDGSTTTKDIAGLMTRAVEACRLARHTASVSTGQPDATACEPEAIVDWIFAVKDDPSTPSGKAFRNAALADELRVLLAGSPAKELPSWGFGASLSASNTDYTFRQGVLSEAIDPATGMRSLLLDTATPLLPEIVDGNRDYLAEAHLFIYKELDRDTPTFAPIWNIPGIMFVPQFTYKSEWGYRPGTKKSICSGGGTTVNVVTCKDVQVDRPYRRGLSTFSTELRMKIEQIPVLGQIGLAPRIAYTFDDGATVYDLPIYFSDAKGEMSAGIRYRHVEGGRDLLGNREIDYDQVSIFFTPLKFNAF